MKSMYLAPLVCAAAILASTGVSAQNGQEGMDHRASKHADFDTFDANKRGYITSDDVKSDEWVHKNFQRCNVKHDGHMSREEYGNCRE